MRGIPQILKVRQVHEINRIYYVCNRCGAANRPTVEELKPKGRWEKKALAMAKDIRNRVLRSSAAIDLNVLIWGEADLWDLCARERECAV